MARLMTPIFIEMMRLLPNRQRSNMFSPFNVVEPAQINLMQPTKETIFQRNQKASDISRWPFEGDLGFNAFTTWTVLLPT